MFSNRSWHRLSYRQRTIAWSHVGSCVLAVWRAVTSWRSITIGFAVRSSDFLPRMRCERIMLTWREHLKLLETRIRNGSPGITGRQVTKLGPPETPGSQESARLRRWLSTKLHRSFNSRFKL